MIAITWNFFKNISKSQGQCHFANLYIEPVASRDPEPVEVGIVICLDCK